ncbi:MAG: adenylate/guanylate cyclase domain-containing protein [Bacteroidetes bacterium]|nr:MAG: adenylate/guanylate cyclase domain-containing protein [Bacteroidota bacterium]
MKKIKFFLIPILILIILRIFFATEFGENIEHKAQDVLFMIRGTKKISNDIVIVDIGDDTFNALNEQWPFPRQYYVKLIKNLEKAGAKQIIFDIEFTEKSDIQSDEMLAETAAKYGNVIFAGKIINILKDNYIKQQILPPIEPIIQKGLNWGTVNISTDNDGFVRRYELFQKRGEKTKYSIGVLSFAFLHKNPYWKKEIHDNRRYFAVRDNSIPKVTYKSTLINYYGPAGTFKTYDFANVIDDSTFTLPELDLDIFDDYLEDQVFKNKIVLVGVAAIEFHDSHHTPFFIESKKLTTGVEIHANFIEMVLNRDYLKEFSYLKFFIIFLISAFVLFVLDANVKPTISILINFLLFCGNFILAFLLFKNKNIIIPILELPLLIIVIYIIGLIFQYIKTVQERIFIKKAFGHYIAPDLVNELIKDPKKLEYGGIQKEISILFCDICSFTTYTESHFPKETVSILREYLTAMVEVVQKNKGTIDKFVGDELIAIFGSPVELEDHAYWACKTALEMREKLSELKNKWESERKDPFNMGIGINSGMVTIGNLGSEQIFDYTAIGDNVNLGARLESLTREYETTNNIIISKKTFLLEKERLIANYIDSVKVKGKTETTEIYELIGLKKELSKEQSDIIKQTSLK